jgi:hypothetical protein
MPDGGGKSACCNGKRGVDKLKALHYKANSKQEAYVSWPMESLLFRSIYYKFIVLNEED